MGLTDWLKAVAGLRYSRFDYDIVDNLRQPGEYVDDYSASKWQPKVGLVIAPLRQIELYANYVVGMRSPTPRTEVRNSVGSIDRVEVAETESYEVGATLRPTSRIDVDATWWRADNTNEVRGIPPGGVQFESLGASKRDGASVDVRWFVFSGARVYGGLSWVKARLLTPATPGPSISRIFPITCIRLEHRHRLGGPTRWPGASAPPSSSRFMAPRISTPLERFEATGISAARFRWAIRSPVPGLGGWLLLSGLEIRRVRISVRVARGSSSQSPRQRDGWSNGDVLTEVRLAGTPSS